MPRRDSHNNFPAALLALAALGAGLPAAQAQSGPTPGGTQIPTAVTVAYQPAANAPGLTASSNTATVTVQQIAGVSLTPSTDNQAIPQLTPLAAAVTLSNTGNGTDTFAVTLACPTGWKAVMTGGGLTATPAQIALGPGQRQVFTLTATPPTTLPRLGTGMIILQVVSRVDPTKKAQASELISYNPPLVPIKRVMR